MQACRTECKERRAVADACFRGIRATKLIKRETCLAATPEPIPSGVDMYIEDQSASFTETEVAGEGKESDLESAGAILGRRRALPPNVPEQRQSPKRFANV